MILFFGHSFIRSLSLSTFSPRITKRFNSSLIFLDSFTSFNTHLQRSIDQAAILFIIVPNLLETKYHSELNSKSLSILISFIIIIVLISVLDTPNYFIYPSLSCLALSMDTHVKNNVVTFCSRVQTMFCRYRKTKRTMEIVWFYIFPLNILYGVANTLYLVCSVRSEVGTRFTTWCLPR